MTSATQPRLHTHIVPAETAGGRVDAWLAARTGLSRVRIQALIAEGHVTCDNAPLSSASSRARAGTCLVVAEPPPAVTETLPQDIPLQVLYEDSHLLVLDKPAGLVVHPAPGHADGTLVNALLHHCDDLAGIGGEQRPGIVHRLDRDTSGVMVVAKTDAALQGLVAQFQRGTIHKTYQAIVHGLPHPAAARIETLIGRCPRDRKRMAVVRKGGRTAISRYRVMEVLGKAEAALVEVEIETGRTHQIRVHLRHAGHPVLGDPVYGNARRDRLLQMPSDRQLLHSWKLAFQHPATGQPLSFEAPLPADFLHALALLRGCASISLPHTKGSGFRVQA